MQRLSTTGSGALAGLAGIAAWLIVTPLDKRITGSRYDDVELLGMAFLHNGNWRMLGLLLHAINGVIFGIVYAHVAEQRLPGPPWLRGLLSAELENAALGTLTPLIDRVHPAIRVGRTGRTSIRLALAQATWRHGVFGAVLGAVYGQLKGTTSVR